MAIERRKFDEGVTGGRFAESYPTGEQSAEMFSAQLQPGVTRKFTLVYDAPGDAKVTCPPK